MNFSIRKPMKIISLTFSTHLAKVCQTRVCSDKASGDKNGLFMDEQ